MSDRLGARGVVTEPIASPSPTSRIRPASSGSRSPSTVSLLGPEARSLSLSRLSPFATLRPSTATFGGLDRSSLSRDLMNELEEAERSTLRSGYEELRAAVRELQRQVKQAPRSWRSEIEAKLGESHQDVLDNFLKDFRGEIDSKVEQAVRTQLRHSSAVEQSFEAFKTSTLREINGLRVELANAVSALPPGPEMYALDMQGSRAQLEARLALVEQQVQSLRASTRSPSPLATEQRLGELEAKLWEQRSQMGVQQEQLQQIRESILSESASSFSRQMQALQGQLEELKDTSREGLRARAADLSSLEAGFDTWRQRVDQVLLESEQKLNQEVESRMQASQERLNAEMRANATSAEAENIRKKWEQTVAQDLRQLTAQVSSLETQLQVHSQDTGTSHVSGLAQRLSAAESSIVEEQSKREVLARQLEERMETLGEVTAARVATGVEALQGYVTSPRSREVARMAVQVDANEKEMKRLLKEIQGVEVALERVLADQRMLQDQAEDSSRERTSRFEERRGSERMERKLKARLEELEAKVEQLASSEGLVEVIVRVEEQKKILQEQDARQRQVEEALKEAQPMLKQLQEQDDRWQKGLEAAQQLQRQHLELRSQLEGHKDVVEVRCLERLELQGKRMEEVAKRMEHLEENAKSSLLQVATTSGESKRPLLDLERRLQSSEQQLEDVLEKLNQHDTSLGQHSREVKKDLQQMLEKQRKVEQQQGDLKKELLQVQELHDQLMTSCGNTQAELNKHAKSIGEVESNAVDSIQQKSYRMETSIAKLDPRIASLEETVKDLIQELGSRLRGFDSSLLQLEPRVAIVESQMPRLQDASKMVAVLSSEARSNSEAAQSRIGRLESDVLKLTSSAEKAEPAIERIQAWMEKSDERLGRLSAQSEAMEEHRGSTQQNVVKMEATCKKVNQQVESSLERLANFEYRLTAFDGRLSGLEPLADLQSSLAELKHQSSSLEVRTQSLQAHQKLLQTNGEAVLGEHRALAQQVAEEHLVLLEVKKESNSSKEDLQQLKLRTEGVEREMQQANKAQEYVQNDMTEFQQAMEQAQQRLKTELQSRLEESRAALQKQTRSLCVLQHSRQDIEHAIEGMKRELAKEKAAASTAASAAASAAEEAAHSATSAVEATKEALQEQAKQKEELLKNFDTWKLEALEEAARRVLEAQEVAVGDLMKTMDRHRYQTKEDTLKTREELLQVMTSNNNLFDGKVVDLQQRLQLLAMEAGRSLGDLNGDLERLRRGDSTLQESTLDLTLPGLRDLRGAVTDEQKRRHQEAQRLGERLQEQCRDHKLGSGGRLSQYQEPSHEEKVSFTVLDGLKGCEVALTAMDRRVTNLEDCLEDKLYDLVRMDANKRAALQQGHLQEMEQKVDKLVHTLHTPSGHETASFSAPGPLHSRDAWREQFRSALNDSSYVKRALQTTRA